MLGSNDPLYGGYGGRAIGLLVVEMVVETVAVVVILTVVSVAAIVSLLLVCY